MKTFGWAVLALCSILMVPRLVTAATASESDDPAKAVQFKCHLDEILGDADRFDALDFTRVVTPCPGGMCLVPIDHLKTSIACRDFTISYGVDSEVGPDNTAYEHTLEISLWSYCGAVTDPAKSQSQTISIAANSRRFQMVAEWNSFITDIKCERE